MDACALQADGGHAASKASLLQHRRIHRMSPPAQRPQDVQRDASRRRPAEINAAGRVSGQLACALSTRTPSKPPVDNALSGS